MEFNLVKLTYDNGNITVEGFTFKDENQQIMFSQNFGEDYLSAFISVSKIAEKNAESDYLTVKMVGFPSRFPGQTALTDF